MRRRAAGVQLLGGAALLLLVLFPLDLYRAGFQLSFVVVLALMLLAVHARRFATNAVDAPQAERVRADSWITRVAAWCDGRMLDALSAAMVAWLASMPLIALHFGQFHAWSVPASLAAAPAVVASLVAGLLKVVLTLAIPEAATLFATLAAWPVVWMRSIVAWFATLPVADVPLAAPPLWLVALAYVAMAGSWLVARTRIRGRRILKPAAIWTARVPMIVCLAAIFVMPVSSGRAASTVTRDDATRLTLLAVGAGQAAVIEQPNGQVTLIDAGSLSLGRPWASCVGPFLRDRGIGRIDRIVVSHANLDHYNAVADLLDRYDVREVVLGPTFERDASHDVSGRAFLWLLEETQMPTRLVAAGDTLDLGGGTRLDVHWPPRKATDLTPNDASLVMTLRHEAGNVLLTGDIQEEGLVGVLASVPPAELAADVLIAPHHGSTERSTGRFIDACDPTTIVSSDSRRLSRKQRNLPELVGDRVLYRTGRVGAVEIALDDEVEVTTFLEQRRRSLTTVQ
jgi:competence protein ComEC